MATHGPGVEAHVEIRNLGEILRDVKAFEPKLATALRRNIRNAAKAAADDAKAEVIKGGASKTGLRAGIARGIRVSISTGKRTNGVRITSTGAGLDASRKPMVKAYNTATFRHPTFGDTNNWQQQSGRPYFGSVIAAHKADVQRGVEQALDEAVRVIDRSY